MSKEKIVSLNIDDELRRLNELEVEVNETIKMIDSIIEMFNNKSEIARGASNRLALLLEQKISLLTRKESIIKNIADLKRNTFTVNTKIEDGKENSNLTKLLLEYTTNVRKQHKQLQEAQTHIREVANEEELLEFFK